MTAGSPFDSVAPHAGRLEAPPLTNKHNGRALSLAAHRYISISPRTCHDRAHRETDEQPSSPIVRAPGSSVRSTTPDCTGGHSNIPQFIFTIGGFPFEHSLVDADTCTPLHQYVFGVVRYLREYTSQHCARSAVSRAAL